MSKVSGKKRVFRAVCCSFLMLMAVAASAQAGELSFATLDKGYQAQMIVESDLFVIINTIEELDEFYAQLGSGTGCPDIDMEQVTVLAVVATPRPTSGYDLEISGLVEKADQTVAAVITDTIPSDTCMTLPVETTPYHLVVTSRKIQGDMNRIEWNRSVVDCK